MEILKEKFPEREECKEDWRAPIREALLKEEEVAKLKTVKDYSGQRRSRHLVFAMV